MPFWLSTSCFSRYGRLELNSSIRANPLPHCASELASYSGRMLAVSTCASSSSSVSLNVARSWMLEISSSRMEVLSWLSAAYRFSSAKASALRAWNLDL